jgi:hypothetical protein
VSINWRRGMYRIWTVLTALWLLIFVALWLTDKSHDSFFNWFVFRNGWAWILVPPFSLAAFFWVFIWVVSGFSSQKSN